MRLYKKTVRIISALIIIFTAFGLSSCNMSLNADSINLSEAVDFTGQNDSSKRMIEKRAEKKVLSGDNTELYLDEKTGAVSIYDRVSQKIWNSLPAFKNSFASDYIISVYDGERICYLDTASCLDEKNGFSYDIEDNTVNVQYNLSYNSIAVGLPVTYSLNGGCIDVSVDIEKCTVSEGNTLISLSVLPFLGAVRYDTDDFGYEVFADYFLVPDGPGALLRTAVESRFSEMTFSVYGKDYYKDNVKASLAAYGIKNGDNALAVTVTDGDENCYIKVFRSNADECNINRIYPEFQITEISGAEGEVNISKSSFNGIVTVSYETLSGESADYMGMAVSVRQALSGAGLISDVTDKNEYPLFVSVISSTDGTKKTTVTSFQQAENLLSILKGKGINEINLILEGFMKNGLDSTAGCTDISKNAGKNKEFNDLTSYASKQQLKLFLGVNLLTDSKGSSAVKSISGDNAQYLLKNPLAPYIGISDFSRKYSSYSKVSSAFSDVLSFLDKESINGLYISDSDDKTVMSDASLKDVSLTFYNESLKKNLSSVKVDRYLMTNGFSLNTFEFTDYINNLVFNTHYPEDGGYSAVPFVPAVIHSSCVYSGVAANTFSAPRLQLLKSVEYGAAAHFMWVFSTQSDKFYELTLSEAVDFYLEAKEKIGDLTSKRMTDHFEYESGVFCTVYDGGTKVYVNYNNYSVLIGEVVVMPYDYLRIG